MTIWGIQWCFIYQKVWNRHLTPCKAIMRHIVHIITILYFVVCFQKIIIKKFCSKKKNYNSGNHFFLEVAFLFILHKVLSPYSYLSLFLARCMVWLMANRICTKLDRLILWFWVKLVLLMEVVDLLYSWQGVVGGWGLEDVAVLSYLHYVDYLGLRIWMSFSMG